ncbi:hypothetical protein [Bosea sp. (in: a-proteobacteria)]|uniref:hypothetical protein n=1 Tax=Bosea sp. (in: a-proteobacteria) TaxID=1871050 RepID=UPI003F6E46DF
MVTVAAPDLDLAHVNCALAADRRRRDLAALGIIGATGVPHEATPYREVAKANSRRTSVGTLSGLLVPKPADRARFVPNRGNDAALRGALKH